MALEQTSNAQINVFVSRGNQNVYLPTRALKRQLLRLKGTTCFSALRDNIESQNRYLCPCGEEHLGPEGRSLAMQRGGVWHHSYNQGKHSCWFSIDYEGSYCGRCLNMMSFLVFMDFILILVLKSHRCENWIYLWFWNKPQLLYKIVCCKSNEDRSCSGRSSS